MFEIIAQMERPANQIIDAAFRDQQRRKLSLVFGIEIRRVEKHLKKNMIKHLQALQKEKPN